MSFGTSVGDVILIVQLAWNTVQGAKQACGEHDELTREVASPHKVLNRVRRELSRSPPGAENDERKRELDEHIAGCEHVLRVMNEVLVKYNALGEDKKKGRSLKRLWKKIKFANGEKSDLADIRSKLNTHTSALMMSLKLYTLGSLGRVEKQLGNQGGELKGIKESINWIAANMTASKSAAGEGSAWTTYENDDRAFWRELRRELHSDGFPRSALEKRKSLIKAYVKELGNRGVFDEDEDEDEGTIFETRGVGVHQGKGKQRLDTIQDDEDVENDPEDFREAEKSPQTPRTPHRNQGKGKQRAATMVDGERVGEDLEDFKKSKGEEPKCTTESRGVKCPRCSKQFTRLYNLAQHLQWHEMFDDLQPFRCRGACCGKYFASLEDRDVHELVHSKEEAFVCKSMVDGTSTGCYRQFARANVLLAHLRSDTGRKCCEEMGLDRHDWGLRKLHGDTDEEGDDSDSENSQNVEVSENGESEPELPDKQNSDSSPESPSSSSDSESDSEPLSKSTPNPLESQSSKVDPKPEAPKPEAPPTTRSLAMAIKQADESRVAKHEVALEEALKKVDEDRAAISRRSIDLLKNGKQSQIIPISGIYQVFINSMCASRIGAYYITAQTTCAQLKEMHYYKKGEYWPALQYLIWDHDMRWIPEAEVLSERGIGPDCLIYETWPPWSYREVVR